MFELMMISTLSMMLRLDSDVKISFYDLLKVCSCELFDFYASRIALGCKF